MSSSPSETPEQRWRRMRNQGQQNASLDQLMDMVGLEEVKAQFLRIRDEISDNQTHFGATNDQLSAIFLGNPGTGKTTLARIYSSLLDSCSIFGQDQWEYVETSGSFLASEGVAELQALIDNITEFGVGALFIDEAHQLLSGRPSVVDYLATAMEDFKDRVVFIFAGYQPDMQKLYEYNSGFRDRIRRTFKLEDYNEFQIQQILHFKVVAQIGEHVRYASCPVQPQDPLFLLKVIARRISRGAGVEGFSNTRTIENVVAQIKSRHIARIHDPQNNMPYCYLTVEDLLGPDCGAEFKSEALDTLNKMVGLEEVKKSVRAMISEVKFNRVRELMDLPPLQESLNKVFLGNPGTGKTTVARLYGQVLVELGMLSNGEVVVKTPADLISDYTGGSEKKTKAILESTKGKVLVIDEAYGLGNKHGAKGTRGITDSFRSGIIDTLVASVQSKGGDDQCILLLGYKDKMDEMYQDANPGLKRRFPLDSAFVFEDFTTEQLRQIWRQKLQTRGLNAADGVENIAIEVLERQRHKLNFGNAGEVDIILDAAQKRYLERIQDDRSQFRQHIYLVPADVDPDYQRLAKVGVDVEQLFKGVVGCDEVKERIRAWPALIQNAKKRDLNIHDLFSMNFTFTGPPGTGKTTTAKNIGTILYGLGLLANNEVNVISATELIGEYIGQTGPKVRRQFEASLGKVLFIDEAYRLSNSHYYGQEAIDEIVTCLTEDKFKNHLVVIFAGYESHIKHLLNQNPGLASRVPEQLHFPSLGAQAATELLCMHLNKEAFSAVYLENGGSVKVAEAMQSLVTLDNWANGRSIENLGKDIKRAALSMPQSGGKCYVSEDIVLKKMKDMRQMLIKQLPAPDDSGRLRPKSTMPPVASDTMADSEPKHHAREKSLQEDNIIENIERLDITASTAAKRKFTETSPGQSSSETNKRPRNLGGAPNNGSHIPTETSQNTVTSLNMSLAGVYFGEIQEQQPKSQNPGSNNAKGKISGGNNLQQKIERNSGVVQWQRRETPKGEGRGTPTMLCPQGYGWRKLGDGSYQCLGGFHRAQSLG
ncbi:P-loop containing nucleoside triphosphate hydrolase protein [Nemania abortiva]|nr:P-loop containing nucleoside triphosphate hydrolase protein [Nemania abortiva]